jgi:hypothetical protein
MYLVNHPIIIMAAQIAQTHRKVLKGKGFLVIPEMESKMSPL